MVSRVQMKIILLLVWGLSEFFNFSQGAAFENAEGTKVVMSFVDSGKVDNAEPRVLISRHNEEVKERLALDGNETFTPLRISIISNTSASGNNFYQKFNFPHNLEIISDILMKLRNQKCVEETTATLEAMVRHERWAVEMFDSFPKFPVGILYGNYYQLGNFDECVGVRKQEGDNIIRGQYCLADIHFKPKIIEGGRAVRSSEKENIKSRFTYNNSIIHWGVCLPSSCTTEDASIFTREIFSSSAENFEVVSVNVEQEKCYTQATPPVSTAEIIYGAIVGSLLIFILLATSIHFWHLRRYKTYKFDPTQKSIGMDIITCFSVFHTTKKFLQTKSGELNLECICGIKFLSMAMIIGGHSLIFMFGSPAENIRFVQKETTNVANTVFTNNPLLVDTFLLVSGFLMCRLLLIELEKRKGRINFLILYVARYVRLTPAYIVVIGLYCTWLYRMGSGPLWNMKVGIERDRCIESWWTNLLYVNNYVNTDQLCMFQSWYLAVDYHLFIIAPFIVYPLWRWCKVGETVLVICTLLSVIVPFWLTYQNNYDPTLMAYPPEIQDISSNFYFVQVYMKTHMRSCSYFIGIFFGYLVHKLQGAGTKIPSYIIYLGWLLATILAAIAMFPIAIFYNSAHEQNSFESAIYASLHRVSWCLAVGWVLLVCITDNAAIVNRFLSYKFFIPASRLTYCAYLANGIVEVYNTGVQRQPMYLSKYELSCKILAHQVLTFSLAFLLCIFFESPIHGMEKILLRGDKVKEVKQQSTLRPVGDA